MKEKRRVLYKKGVFVCQSAASHTCRISGWRNGASDVTSVITEER